MWQEPSLFQQGWQLITQLHQKAGKQFWLAIALFFAGILGILLLSVYLLQASNASTSSTSLSMKPPTRPPLGTVRIDVAGAVPRPGAYTLASGDRVGQAIANAGGFLDTADHEFISKTLNLAALITDGEKIFIPFSSAGEATPAIDDDSSLPKQSEPSPTSTKISINEATIDELDTLPGVGTKRAESIIAGRPYSKLTDLLTKKIVSDSVFAELQKSIEL